MMNTALVTSVLAPLLIGGIIRVYTDKYTIVPFAIDFGLKWKNKPIIGSSKTWQGFLVISLISWVVGIGINNITYNILPMNYGFWLGFYYTTGEIINSFIKRRVDIMPSESAVNGVLAAIQYIVDQIDGFVIIALYLLTMRIFSDVDIIVLLLAGFVLHVIIDGINCTYGSKNTSDMYNLHSFWQLSFYFVLFPARYFLSSKISIPATQSIIISNHMSFFDFLKILLSIPLADYIRFVPFGYIISSKYYRSFFKICVVITGGVSNQQEHYFDPKPIEIISKMASNNYNFLWFWEGRIRKINIPLQKVQFGSGLYQLLTIRPTLHTICIRINEPHCKVGTLKNIQLDLTSKKALLTSFNENYFPL